jgi:hypothetical protein
MWVHNKFCVIMAGTAAIKNTCLVQLPKSRDRVRVGVFARFQEKGLPPLKILGKIGEFNSKHGAEPIRLIRPEIAELIVNPASMFPDKEPMMALSIAEQCKLPSRYPFEGEALFPTSTIFAYPAPRMGLGAEVAAHGKENTIFTFETGGYSGQKVALLAPNISESILTGNSLVRDGDLTRFIPDGDSLIPFFNFPDSKRMIFTLRHGYSEQTRKAFCAIGGTLHTRDSKSILRQDSAFVGFIARKGKHNDHSSKTLIFMNVLPSTGFRLALVEIPDASLDAFMGHAPSIME